jgi:hypothetical protein
MLRNPAETVVSMHRDQVFLGNEEYADLSSALAAEAERRSSTPPGLTSPLLYREQVAYAVHLRRYLSLFGRDRVHVVIFDDVRDDPVRAFGGVLRFLGLSTEHAPMPHLKNPAKSVRSSAVRRVILNRPTWVSRGARLLPYSWRLGAWRGLMRLNSRPASTAPPDPKLMSLLRIQMEPTVRELAVLLRRDLSSWSASAPTKEESA